MRRAFCLALLPLVMLSGSADADIFKCSFTEPFITTIYSTSQSTLTIQEASQPASVIANVSLQVVSPSVFELWTPDRKPLQRLTLSYKGSDGMSDTLFPYDVEWLDRRLRGGCTSNHLPARQQK